MTRRNPDATALTEVMVADHGRIGPGMEALEAGARRWLTDESARDDVAAALAALSRSHYRSVDRRRQQVLLGVTPDRSGPRPHSDQCRPALPSAAPHVVTPP